MHRLRTASTAGAIAQSISLFLHRTLSQALIGVALVASPGVAVAQAIAPTGVYRVASGDGNTSSSAARAVETPPSDGVVLSRIGLGFIGTAVGATAGVLLGARVGKNCPYDECAWWDAVLSGAVGAVLGSAIVAGRPAFGSSCSTTVRIATGAGAALVGGFLGGYSGASAGGNGVVIGFMAGTSIGGGIGASICR